MIKTTTPGNLVTGYTSLESARVFASLCNAARKAAPALLKKGGHR